MAMTDQVPSEPDKVERLADEFLARYRAGERPSIDQFVGNDAEIADELRSLLKAIVILEQNAPPADLTVRAGNEGAAIAEEVPHQIGDYLIQREIGRGGMGIVYQAAQQSLDRQVALKVLSSPGLLDSAHLERFRREARAAARLQHPHIVPVFDFGTQNGVYYYAMQLIVGQSLDVVIRSLQNSRAKSEHVLDARSQAASTAGTASGGELAAAPTHDGKSTTLAASDTEFSSSATSRQFYQSVARIGRQAAEALAYAHSEGVLHRDVKPSNLLLDSKGNLWMTDFGLAKAEGDDELTHTGDFVGTLRYTAPERLEGWSDRRSDIYGLGVTLYELLTLQPFFPDRSRTVLLRRIAGSSPVAPRRIDRSIPVDLETIVLKAVAKEPAARYHRAEQMADDLRRFLADRPILARRSTVLERFGRWCRRNPAVASLAVMVIGLLLTAVIILAMSNAKIRRESAARIAALKERQDALSAKDEAWGQVWLYRGLYEIDGDEAQTLANFDKALQLAPNKADILWLRGFMLGSWGRYDEAAADMTRARTMLGNSKLISPAARDWFVASVFAAKGDRAAYQAACLEALQKIRAEHDPDELGILLWMCTVTPYSVDNSARLADLADAVLLPNRDAPTRDQLLAVGAALYRAGKFDDARRRLQEALQQCAAKKPTVDPMSEVFAHLFLAMTNERLGLTDEAQANFSDASRLAKTIKPPCWVSKMQHKMLTEEAQTVVGAAGESLVEQSPNGV
jgi:serine/threonine protein kinase/Tfp pilus assembly protein PilF